MKNSGEGQPGQARAGRGRYCLMPTNTKPSSPQCLEWGGRTTGTMVVVEARHAASYSPTVRSRRHQKNVTARGGEVIWVAKVECPSHCPPGEHHQQPGLRSFSCSSEWSIQHIIIIFINLFRIMGRRFSLEYRSLNGMVVSLSRIGSLCMLR